MVTKVFITGISGLLGSTLAKHLISLGGYEVSGIDNEIGGVPGNVPTEAKYFYGDILNTELLKKITKGVDVVFHAAALPYEGLSVFSPTITATSIVSGTLSVGIACLHNKVRLMINCSSMARYGQNITPFLETYPTNPVDPYGLAKVQAEQHLAMLSSIHGLNYVTVVPHNVIGVGQRYYDPFRNVVGIMINRALQNNSIIIYGDGKQKRSFSDALDCIIAITAIINTKKDICGQVYNIGPDNNEITILDLAHMVTNLTKKPNVLKFFPDRPVEVKDAFCSSDKIKKEFGYKAEVPMAVTVNNMVEWIKPRIRAFQYHLPLELITDKTPKTWTDKLI